jgi:L-malate glycosyltransferase
MHIAFLTPEYPHPLTKHAGGMGTSIKNLAIALVKQNIQVTVIIFGQKKSDHFIENGINFYTIANKNYVVGKWFFYRKHVQNIVNKIVVKNKIDVIEAGDWTGFTAFMKFKAPLVIRLHGSDTYFCSIENRPQKLKNKVFETIALKTATAYVAPSKFTANYTANLFKLNKNTIQVVANGIDTEIFKPTDLLKPTENSILYFGTLIRKKGVLQLPEIFNQVRKQIPEAKLILIGSDSPDIVTQSKSTWELMKQAFSLLDIANVEYLGKMKYDEVQNYIKQASVCVFPSYAETFGMVTVEAMAMQKAVITSDFAWNKELLMHGESGYLVNPDDTVTFAQKICDVLQNNEKALKMGINARKQVIDKFDSTKIAKQNIEFYQSVIKK